MKRHGWTCQEPGWWTRDKGSGSVWLEGYRQWAACVEVGTVAKFRTATEAMEWCEQQAGGRQAEAE